MFGNRSLFFLKAKDLRVNYTFWGTEYTPFNIQDGTLTVGSYNRTIINTGNPIFLSSMGILKGKAIRCYKPSMSGEIMLNHLNSHEVNPILVDVHSSIFLGYKFYNLILVGGLEHGFYFSIY